MRKKSQEFRAKGSHYRSWKYHEVLKPDIKFKYTAFVKRLSTVVLYTST